MMLTHMIDIDETLKLTQGESQRSRSLPAGKHLWKYENVHLYQTGATDIFTRRKCPCLRTSKTKLRLRGKGTFAAEVGVSSSSHIFLDYA